MRFLIGLLPHPIHVMAMTREQCFDQVQTWG